MYAITVQYSLLQGTDIYKIVYQIVYLIYANVRMFDRGNCSWKLNV